jgi:hypothetical protein
MITLEKKELEFLMTAVNNVPVRGVEGCKIAVNLFDKLAQIGTMKSPVVIESPAEAVAEPSPNGAAEKKQAKKAPTKKASKK